MTYHSHDACRECRAPFTKEDRVMVYFMTHCKNCDNWISGDYGKVCENCWFESDEFAEKVARAKEWEDAFSDPE